MPKCLHNNDNSEKHNNFLNNFFHDESVSFAVRNYFWSCDLSNPNNFVIVFFLFVQQIKARNLNKRDICVYSNALNLSSGE